MTYAGTCQGGTGKKWAAETSIAEQNVVVVSKKSKMKTVDANESCLEDVALWSAKMNQIAPNLADKLIAFAESCAAIGVSYKIVKVMAFRLQTNEGLINPIAIDPDNVVEIPWSVGRYKNESRTFALAMAAALPNGDFYEAEKMWITKIKIANGKRRKATAIELLDVAEQARTALEKLKLDLQAVPD